MNLRCVDSLYQFGLFEFENHLAPETVCTGFKLCGSELGENAHDNELLVFVSCNFGSKSPNIIVTPSLDESPCVLTEQESLILAFLILNSPGEGLSKMVMEMSQYHRATLLKNSGFSNEFADVIASLCKKTGLKFEYISNGRVGGSSVAPGIKCINVAAITILPKEDTNKLYSNLGPANLAPPIEKVGPTGAMLQLILENGVLTASLFCKDGKPAILTIDKDKFVVQGEGLSAPMVHSVFSGAGRVISALLTAGGSLSKIEVSAIIKEAGLNDNVASVLQDCKIIHYNRVEKVYCLKPQN